MRNAAAAGTGKAAMQTTSLGNHHATTRSPFGDQPGAEGRSEMVSFAIGDEQYGVDIMAVREIKEWSNVTRLPEQPDYVRGVLNLRGAIIPIIDLRCGFGQGSTDATAMHIVIIVQIDDRQVGLLADRVLDIVAFEPGKVQPVPAVTSDQHANALSGLVTVEGAMIALIDLPNMLSAFEAAGNGRAAHAEPASA
jgi:purine-binding chemotaxis protein CheW